MLSAKKVNVLSCHTLSQIWQYIGRRNEACKQIAQLTGILVDPVYTLAACEMAELPSDKEWKGDANVAMLQSGGKLCMFGLAQRHKSFLGH